MAKRILLASLIALIIATIVSVGVLAASTYNISEYSTNFRSFGLGSYNPCPGGDLYHCQPRYTRLRDLQYHLQSVELERKFFYLHGLAGQRK